MTSTGLRPGRSRAAGAGIALPAALVSVVVLGALLGAVLWAVHTEMRASRARRSALVAQAGADAFWPTVLARPGSLGVDRLPAGDSMVLQTAALPGGAAVTAAVHALGTGLFLIESQAVVSGPHRSRSQVQVLARLDSAPDSLGGWALELVPLPPPSWSRLPPMR